MKKPMPVVFAALFVFLVVAVGPASANVLTNPGFENPTVTPPAVDYYGAGAGWIPFNFCYTVSSAIGVTPNTGNQCLKLFGGCCSGAFQQFPAVPGQIWNGGVWMLNWSGDQMTGGQVGAINIEWIQADGSTQSAITPYISNGTFTAATAPVDVWTLQTVTGVAPADAAYARLVIITGDFQPGGPGGAPFFDDAFFEILPGYKLDIKPMSCPNPLNVTMFENTNGNAMFRKGGVLPVAIVGDAANDVYDIDVSSLLLEGVAPLRSHVADVTAPFVGEECGCNEEGPDGIADLTLKFRKAEIIEAIGPVTDGAVIPLTLTGTMLDGTPIQITDCVRISSKEPQIQDSGSSSDATLGHATPNPFNPVTRISFVLPTETEVRLTVYDVGGHVVERLVNGVRSAGEHTVVWNATGRASGVYFYRLEAGSFSETRRMILLK